MATRKINFQRFVEGEPFSTNEIDRRFRSFEIDLNSRTSSGILATDGLESTALGEGALNYQHLASAGHDGTTDYNFGSTLVHAGSVRNDPSKHPNGWQRYNPSEHEHLWTQGRSTGWSVEFGETIGDSRFPASFDFNAQEMVLSFGEIGNLKMGTDYFNSNDPGYTTGILVMFNTQVLSDITRDGFSIELQVKTAPFDSSIGPWVTTWSPIKGCCRWSLQTGDMQTSVEPEPTVCQPIAIRALLTRSRILANSATLNPAATEANLEVTGLRARIGFIGDKSTLKSKKDHVFLKESVLTAMAIRGRRT